MILLARISHLCICLHPKKKRYVDHSQILVWSLSGHIFWYIGWKWWWCRLRQRPINVHGHFSGWTPLSLQHPCHCQSTTPLGTSCRAVAAEQSKQSGRFRSSQTGLKQFYRMVNQRQNPSRLNILFKYCTTSGKLLILSWTELVQRYQTAVLLFLCATHVT